METLRSLITIAATSGAEISQRHEAFGEIVHRFQDMAYACAYAILADADMAQDAAQEAFVTAWLQLGQLREPDAFPAWFRRIIVSQCNRVVRRRYPETVPLDYVCDVPSDEVSPPIAAEQCELRERIKRDIQAMPEKERLVTVLFYITGDSQSDIASFLGIPVTTVKNRLRTARKKLKERMADMFQDYFGSQNPSRSEEFAQRVRFFIAIRSRDVETAREMLTKFGKLAHSRESRRETMTHMMPGISRGALTSQIAHQDEPATGMEDGWSPLHWAASVGETSLIDLLVSHGVDVNARSIWRGMTPLHLAARSGQFEAARFLMENKADVNAKDEMGGTPLHWTALADHLECAEVLLYGGADPNATTNSGSTPLHWSAISGSDAVAALLMANGAEPHVKAQGGTTVLSWAKANRRPGIVRLIGAQKGAIPTSKKKNKKREPKDRTSNTR
jgi:RNA polymerase sigma factor (sigma-70 family)